MHQHGDSLFGPRLQFVRFPGAALEDISPEGIHLLVTKRFLVFPEGKEFEEGSTRSDAHAAVVVDNEADLRILRAAIRVVRELNKSRKTLGWDILTRGDIDTAPRDIYFPLAWQEYLIEDHQHLLTHGRVIASGEARTGSFLGPMLSRPDQAEHLASGIHSWEFTRTYLRLSGRDRLPNYIAEEALGDPVELARQIEEILRESSPSLVSLCPSQELRRIGSLVQECDEFCPQLDSWDYGVIRDYRNIQDSGMWVASARTASLPGAHGLESNSGKGLTKQDAEERLYGEAIERLAAWRANSLPPVDVALCAAQLPGIRKYNMSDFHPFGAAWDAVGDSQAETDHLLAYSVTEPRRVVGIVPRDLVPFPAFCATRRPHTDSVTSGLASHRDLVGALASAVRELSERINFYSNFPAMKPGFLINSPGREARECGADLAGTFERIWLVVYPRSRPIPIVHSFGLAHDSTWICRGSGSGLSLDEAREAALTELVQTGLEFRRGTQIHSHVDTGHWDWTRPEVIALLATYLNSLRPWHESKPEVLLNSAALLRTAVDRCRADGSDLMYVPLPKVFHDRFAVRALVTNAPVHAHPSASSGGTKVGFEFPYKIPT